MKSEKQIREWLALTEKKISESFEKVKELEAEYQVDLSDHPHVVKMKHDIDVIKIQMYALMWVLEDEYDLNGCINCLPIHQN